MTPKQKAKEIYSLYYTPLLKYKGAININNAIELYKCAKKCALVAVNQMIEQNGELYLDSLGDKTIEFYKKKNNYLFEVKIEIEKL